MSDHIIEIRNANIYQGNSLILQDVNINIDRGEFVYLVGKTGTGKSSLLKTLYGELPMKEGSATVAGFDIKSLTWKTVPFLRRTISLLSFHPVACNTNSRLSCTLRSVSN